MVVRVKNGVRTRASRDHVTRVSQEKAKEQLKPKIYINSFFHFFCFVPFLSSLSFNKIAPPLASLILAKINFIFFYLLLYMYGIWTIMNGNRTTPYEIRYALCENRLLLPLKMVYHWFLRPKKCPDFGQSHFQEGNPLSSLASLLGLSCW